MINNPSGFMTHIVHVAIAIVDLTCSAHVAAENNTSENATTTTTNNNNNNPTANK